MRIPEVSRTGTLTSVPCVRYERLIPIERRAARQSYGFDGGFGTVVRLPWVLWPDTDPNNPAMNDPENPFPGPTEPMIGIVIPYDLTVSNAQGGQDDGWLVFVPVSEMRRP